MSDDLLLSLTDDENRAPADAAAGEALALAGRGDWARAERLFEASRASAARSGDDVALAVALTNRGQALARLGRLEEAALTLDASLDVRRRLLAAGAVGEAVVARGVADVAAVAAELGDVDEAARLLRRARAQAAAGGAEDVVAAIDERLAAARALGAADEEEPAVELAILGDEPDPVEPMAVAEPIALEQPLDTTFDGAGEVSADAGRYEPLALEPAVAELDADVTFGLDALPLLADEDGAQDDGPALPFLDPEPLAETEPAGEDAWSLADPAPFDGLDAEAVHSRARGVELAFTPAYGTLAIPPEPTEVGAAAAFPPIEEEEERPAEEPLSELEIPPAPSFPDVYESPLDPAAAVRPAEPAAPRRRTTRDVPLVAPPEPKRAWWRRFGIRG